MKWKSHKKNYEEIKIQKERERKWHNWFAWYPVKIDDYYHWMKIVERKWVPLTVGTKKIMKQPHWEYRESTLRAGLKNYN
jgi:hypothetical protein